MITRHETCVRGRRWTHRGAMAALALLAAVPAGAQNPIQWMGNGRQGIAIAKQRGLPLMFYVTGSSRDNESDLERAQRQTFRDPLVVSIAESRFVPVRIARTSANRPILEEFGLPTQHGMYVALVTPSGELLGQINTEALAEPRGVAGKLTDAFRKYRDQVFREALEPVLTADPPVDKDVTQALRKVRDMIILSADEAVAGLLKHDTLPNPLRKDVCETLALLSTKASVEALVTRAPTDRLAAAAMQKCGPAACEPLVSCLEHEDAQVQVAAYDTLAKLTNLSRPRPAGFWRNANAEQRAEEFERAREAAKPVAKRWNETEGRYR